MWECPSIWLLISILCLTTLDAETSLNFMLWLEETSLETRVKEDAGGKQTKLQVGEGGLTTALSEWGWSPIGWNDRMGADIVQVIDCLIPTPTPVLGIEWTPGLMYATSLPHGLLEFLTSNPTFRLRYYRFSSLQIEKLKPEKLSNSSCNSLIAELTPTPLLHPVKSEMRNFSPSLLSLSCLGVFYFDSLCCWEVLLVPFCPNL